MNSSPSRFIDALCDGNVSFVRKFLNDCIKRKRCNSLNEVLYTAKNPARLYIDAPKYVPEFDEFDENGFTPLMIAIRLWYLSVKMKRFVFASRYWAIIRLLLENGSDTKKRSPTTGWNTLADAVLCGSHTLTRLLIHHQVAYLRRLLKTVSLPRIVHALENLLPDFKLSLNIKVASVVPGISMLCPHDTITITKFGRYLRLDQNVYAEARLGEAPPPKGISGFLLAKRTPASICLNFERWPPMKSEFAYEFAKENAKETENDSLDFAEVRVLQEIAIIAVRYLQGLIPMDVWQSNILPIEILNGLNGEEMTRNQAETIRNFFVKHSDIVQTAFEDILKNKKVNNNGLDIEVIHLIKDWLEATPGSEILEVAKSRQSNKKNQLKQNDCNDENTSKKTISMSSSLSDFEENNNLDPILSRWANKPVDSHNESENSKNNKIIHALLDGGACGLDQFGRGWRCLGQGVYHAKKKWMKLADPMNKSSKDHQNSTGGDDHDVEYKSSKDASNILESNGSGAVRGDLEISDILLTDITAKTDANIHKNGQIVIKRNWVGAKTAEVRADGKGGGLERHGQFWCRKFDVHAHVGLCLTKQKLGNVQKRFEKDLDVLFDSQTLHIHKGDFDEVRSTLASFASNDLSSTPPAASLNHPAANDLQSSKTLLTKPSVVALIPPSTDLSYLLIDESLDDEQDDDDTAFNSNVKDKNEELFKQILEAETQRHCELAANNTIHFSHVAEQELVADASHRKNSSTDVLKLNSTSAFKRNSQENLDTLYVAAAIVRMGEIEQEQRLKQQQQQHHDENNNHDKKTNAKDPLCDPLWWLDQQEAKTIVESVLEQIQMTSPSIYPIQQHNVIHSTTTSDDKGKEALSSVFLPQSIMEVIQRKDTIEIINEGSHLQSHAKILLAKEIKGVSLTSPSRRSVNDLKEKSLNQNDDDLEICESSSYSDDAMNDRLELDENYNSDKHQRVFSDKRRFALKTLGFHHETLEHSTGNPFLDKKKDNAKHHNSTSAEKSKSKKISHLANEHQKRLEGLSVKGQKLTAATTSGEEKVWKEMNFEMISSSDIPIGIDHFLIVLDIFSSVSPELSKLRSFISDPHVRKMIGTDCPTRMELPLILGTSVVIEVMNYESLDGKSENEILEFVTCAEYKKKYQEVEKKKIKVTESLKRGKNTFKKIIAF